MSVSRVHCAFRGKGAALGRAASLFALAAVLSLPAAARGQPCEPPAGTADFERVPIVTGLTLPMAFEEAPDGRIFLIERGGDVKVYNPTSGLVSLVGHVDVKAEAEFGLLGMALDPAFTSNNHIYLYYTVNAPGYTTRVSRFTVTSSPLGLGSESVLLTIPHVLNFHVAGDMNFGPDGNLYITTGADDFAFTALYTGCNFGNAASDCASATSSSKADLRGKVLRITPTAAGGYTIPPGNLFSPGSASERPEIFAMGNRNPFRFSIDDAGGSPVLYVAEVGTRYEEVNRITAAGYYGWPFFEGPNSFYPNTTGLSHTPPWIWYHQDTATSSVPIPGAFGPGVPAGRSVMAGPVYHHRPSVSNPHKLPATYDGDFFFWDFSKGKIWGVDMTSAGVINNVYPFLEGVGFGPAANTNGQNGTMDMAIASDDTLLVLEYWSGRLYRVNYLGVAANQTPVIAATATPTNGSVPLTVTFSACPGGSAGCTFDPDGDPLTYRWDFDGDGTDDLVGGTVNPPPHTYSTAGTHTARLQVVDSALNTATQFFPITAGNHAPVVLLSQPPDGGFFQWGDTIQFAVSVADLEDGTTPGTIPCGAVQVQTAFGHDGHDHGGDFASGCSGTFTLSESVDDPEVSNVYYIVAAQYTDNPVGPAGALTTKKSILLHPKRKEAELASPKSGVTTAPNTDPWTGGDSVVTEIDDGDYIVLPGRNLQNAGSVTYRVATGSVGGRIELRLDSPAGTLLANTIVGSTGGYDSWTTVGSSVGASSGKHDLYFVFKSYSGGDPNDLFDLNWIEFTGDGISTDVQAPAIESVTVGRDPTVVWVTMSEDLHFSAETEANYAIGGLSIIEARIMPGERVVRLTTSPMTAGASYTLNISNVQDLHGHPVAPGTSAPFTYKGFDVPSGLTALWRFDEASGSTALDASGNGNNAALVGGPTRVPGALGTAVSLNGSGQYVDIPNQSYSGDFTFATWVKLSGVVSNADALVGVGGAGQDMNFYAGRLRLFAPGDVIVANSITPAGVWQHCALVRSGSTLTLYLDGVADAQATWTGTFTPGVLGWGNAGTFGGLMDDTRLYGRALSAEEVGTLAASEPFGLVAHYKMNDGHGTSVKDSVFPGSSAPSSGGPGWENGVRGGSIQLDGVNDAVDIPDRTFPGDFTVAVWVRLEGEVSNLDGIVGQNGPGQDINFYAGRLRLYAPGDVVIANTPVEPNVWTHTAITRQGSTLRLYLNGVLDATGTWAGVFAPKVLGRGHIGFFGGGMDDVRFYDEALTEAQVQVLARPAVSAPLAHWTLDDGAGTVAVDAVPDGLDAVLASAFPAWTSQGQSRGALALNGASEWLDPGEIELGGDFTVAAWVKMPSPINNQDAIVGQQGPGPDINFYDQRIRLYSAAPLGDIVVATSPAPAQTFTHYAITRKAGRVGIFVNGVKDTGPTATSCWFGNFPIQALGRGAAGFFGGTLDDVQIYDRALRTAEIENLARAVPTALVGHWMFNEGAGTLANDSSPTGNDGVTSGGPVWTAGKIANGLSLDGVNDWVDISDLSIPGDFSIVFWVNLAPGITNQDAIVGRVGAGQDINFYAGRLRLWTGSADVVVASTVATAGVWTQYAITRQGSTLRLYVNGSQDATGTWAGVFSPAAIGRGQAGFLAGTIDDLRIYTRALSQSELY